jgi:predicted lipoprotein with Yx(FWY)xxD motif
MKRLLILGAVVAVAAVVVAVVAYSAGGKDNSPNGAAPATGGATVSSQEIAGEGAVLVDSAGRPLYASNQENAAGKVLCTDGCTSFWMPLTVAAKGSPTEHAVSGKLGVVKRPDGARQVTLDGKLLYSFTQDSPGKVTGDGFQDAFGGRRFTWHVVHADGASSSSGSTTTNTGSYGY